MYGTGLHHVYLRCGESYVDDYVDELGHDFKYYFSDENATCEKNGTETAVCNRADCSQTHTRADANAAHGHDYEKTVTAPTCTEQGYTTYTCACGESYVDDYVDELGHDFKYYFSDGNATCEKDGTETAVCNRADCSQTHTRAEENSAHGHDYEKTVTAPTCTEQGYTTYTCACGESYVDDYVDELGHDFKYYFSDENATCEKDGTETAVCNRANCLQTHTKTEENSALGHIFTNYVSDNNATFEADGTKTATCDRADCTKTSSVTEEGSKLDASLYFIVSDGAISLFTSYGKSNCTEIYVPATINGETISGIGIVRPDVIEGGNYAFSGSDLLRTVTIAEGITFIGDYAFKKCISLAHIEIPQSVTYIGDYAFGECLGLSSIKFNGTIAQWNAIEKGGSWMEDYTGKIPATEVVCTDGTVVL